LGEGAASPSWRGEQGQKNWGFKHRREGENLRGGGGNENRVCSKRSWEKGKRGAVHDRKGPAIGFAGPQKRNIGIETKKGKGKSLSPGRTYGLRNTQVTATRFVLKGGKKFWEVILCEKGG